MFVVGPESAGALPGPVCYDKGGTELTITDANLILGRILPIYFPKIFGPDNNQPLNKEKTVALFDKVTGEINAFLESQNDPKRMTVEEVAMGFIRVANEAMCRPIRAITQGKGYDTSVHMLSCFGGAGGQHACAIANSLGISTVFVPKYAGILSAVGIFLADVVHELQEPAGKTFCEGI
jgi:5-oxoprolinase (ATP-hydrolysing)